MKNFFAKLVPENDPEYQNWYKNFVDTTRIQNTKIGEKNPYNSLAKKEYRLWEKSLKKIIGLSIKEYPNKILRFNHERGIVSYRELDFIAEIDKTLLFCEIKMCKSYNKRRKNLVYDAWKQVSKSSNIACQNYSLLRPLVIIVDMSFVLEIDNKKNEKPTNLKSIKNIEYIINNIEKYDPHFLCFDSHEIFKEAADKKILKYEDVIRFRSIHKKSDYSDEKKSEKSKTFSSEYKIDINNPFSSLKKPGK